MPGDPNILAGQIPTAADLRALSPWTLILSGTQTIGNATLSAVTTMAVINATTQIPHSISSGVLTLTDGGFFGISIIGAFPTANTTGTQRFVGLDGSTFGRPLSATTPPVGVAGWGQQPSASTVLEIEPGESLTTYVRHDGNANLSVTVRLTLSLLPTPT